MDTPCMNELCTEKLLDLASKATTVLEWGSGGSTIAMSRLMTSGVLYSYEHDISFYNRIKPKLPSNVKYHLVSKDDYVLAPKNIYYSVILVDGIEREKCLIRAREELLWDILLLHDAERERYKPWMDAFNDDTYNKSFVKNLWICEKK